MKSPLSLLAIAVFAATMLLGSVLSISTVRADTHNTLTGEHVASISKTFLRSHYSRAKFDDEHSSRMLRIYINRLDSGHYYFLQGDIDEFQKYSRRLDDLVSDGNIDPAFEIFNRFRKRVNALEEPIRQLLAESFDLKSEDSTYADRKELPFAGNAQEQKRLWKKKIKFALLEQVLSGTKLEEGKSNLERRYRSFRVQVNRWSRNDVLTTFLNAFTASYDPHSSYLSPDDLENFNISLRLSLEGIGATLRWEDGVTVVTSIIAGGAAWREGSLKQEDKIISVAQGDDGKFEDVRNMRLIDVVKRIRGARGTTVRLAVLRKDDAPVETRQEISIVRDKIVLKEGEAKGEIIERPRGKGSASKIGHIKLPSFYVDFSRRNSDPNNYKSSSRDVARILEEFKRKKVDGIILDLRDNGGGGLDEAVSLSGLFLRKGPVVMVKSVRGRISVMSNPHSKPSYEGPLVVMTNRYSASASEILAGALQDYGRAVLIGDNSTFGKGTVQNIIQLPRGMGALKTTVAKFYRPGSSSTQNKGVVPDIVLPSLNNHLDMGEASLENALLWDSIRKASFKPWDNLGAILPVIRERTRLRQQNLPEFAKVRERVRDYLKRKKDRKIITISQMIEASKKGASKPKRRGRARGKPSTGKKDNGKDFYLEETARILEDVINLRRNRPLNQVVIRKS